MSAFNKSNWSKKDYALKYLDFVNIYIPVREQMFFTLCSFFKHFLSEKKAPEILDLGCGDGELTKRLLDINPKTQPTLTDPSVEMLEKAKKNLEDNNYEEIFLHSLSFEDIIKDKPFLGNFDFVFSSLAIHHITTEEKQELFNYIYSNLNKGGYFVNLDVALSINDDMEDFYIELRREITNIKRDKANIGAEDFDDFIERHRRPEHHSRLDTLTLQMTMLETAGFKDVDCYYKSGMFIAYGGRKD